MLLRERQPASAPNSAERAAARRNENDGVNGVAVVPAATDKPTTTTTVEPAEPSSSKKITMADRMTAVQAPGITPKERPAFTEDSNTNWKFAGTAGTGT